jgi:amino acid transporter
MVSSLKEIVIGSPIASENAHHERLSKKIALAVFSSDALSSVAYATEEILLVLAVAATHYGQATTFKYVIPISIAIAVLLVLVSISYRQTIYAYPSGGGAYIVAKDNLGTTPGLIAAASLLIDYVLTVSVSIAAGVAAITSAVQGTHYEWIADHRVLICIMFILTIMLANLRGVRESGMIFSIPTYVFIFSFLGMILWGLGRYFISPVTVSTPIDLSKMAIAEGYSPAPLSLMLILGAFSNGCSALTGVEAISNGVPAFKKPESRNAATTLIWMAVTLLVLFLGTSVLAYLYHVVPLQNETAISQFARMIFSGPFKIFYYVVQAATAAILVLAANTSFADFPRLSSLLARDGFLPRQFANQGDRLVFSNGIVILSVLSSLLLILFDGDTHRLIPLYAVGVFLSFTLSQTGMVVHWWKERGESRVHKAAKESRLDASIRPEASTEGVDAARRIGAVTEIADWKQSIVINALGAVATLIVLTVFIITKFIHGAWIVVVLIPIIVVMFRSVKSHYNQVAEQLLIKPPYKLRKLGQTVIVPVSGVHTAVLSALEYAQSISKDVRAVYVSVDEKLEEKMKADWKQFDIKIPLIVLDSPYRSLVRPLLDYIDKTDRESKESLITVVMPEFVAAKWWHHFLHNQSSLFIKGALIFRPSTVVTTVRFHLKR